VDLRYIGWEGVSWMHLIQNGKEEAGSCEYGNEVSGSIKGGDLLG